MKEEMLKRIRDLHFYGTKEALIKVTIWWVAWIFGIKVAYESNVDRLSTGGAFLFFSLALLMEFLERKKKYFLGRLIHAVFCASCIVILVSACDLLFCKNDLIPQKYIFWISIYLIGFLAVDAFINQIFGIERGKNENNNANNSANEVDERVKKFKELGESGALGCAGGSKNE